MTIRWINESVKAALYEPSRPQPTARQVGWCGAALTGGEDKKEM